MDRAERTGDYQTALVSLLRERAMKISTAESLTGGLIGAHIVDVSGASAVFEGGAVCYTEQSKMSVLGVRRESLDKYTAVSEQVAREMAIGSCARFGTDIAISATGIAGPGDEGPNFPAGLVYIGICYNNKTTVYKYNFIGSRAQVREQATQAGLERAIESILNSEVKGNGN